MGRKRGDTGDMVYIFNLLTMFVSYKYLWVCTKKRKNSFSLIVNNLSYVPFPFSSYKPFGKLKTKYNQSFKISRASCVPDIVKMHCIHYFI